MRFPLIIVVTALALVAACEESKGGFGEADIKDPGINVKQTNDKPDAPPDFAGAMKMSPAYKEGELVVTVALKPGFHAYAPGEQIGKPVTVSVKEANGWKAESVDVPAGKEKDLGELGKSQVLEGTFPVKAKVSGGSGELQGELEIQVCTDSACDRPRKHAFALPTT